MQANHDIAGVGKILVVDDEEDIVDLLSYNLSKEGFSVKTATDGAMAIEKARQFRPDLIILDVMMPGLDGFAVCRLLRKEQETSGIAIIFLTAKSGDIDHVVGLELGADDYLVKPVSPRVLVARIKTAMRRLKEGIRTETIAAPEVMSIGDVMINRLNYTIKVDGRETFLPKKEFELLAFLAANKGKVFSRESLLRRIWGESVFVIDRTVDVHVSKIRDKLGKHGEMIETVKGVGYRLRLHA